MKALHWHKKADEIGVLTRMKTAATEQNRRIEAIFHSQHAAPPNSRQEADTGKLVLDLCVGIVPKVHVHSSLSAVGSAWL